MRFGWNDANVQHIAKHGILPEEAEQVIASDPIDLEFRLSAGELRVTQLGITDAGKIVVVVTTMRGEWVRVVTAYPAKRALRRFYAAQKGIPDASGIGDETIRQ